jgi:lysozyme family protein
MNHPFSELEPEYKNLLSICQVQRKPLADQAAARLLKDKAFYTAVTSQTGVPAAFIMALNERESSGNLNTYLGNGEPLGRVTRLVPKGRGPFPNWSTGAIDAIKYDHLDGTAAWTLPFACYRGESWNGFGPRAHGIHTGYLWAGTNIYSRGKYVADGVWDANHVDTQLGVIPVLLSIMEKDPSLKVGDAIPIVQAPSVIPAPQPAPEGVIGAASVQAGLNKLGQNPPLVVDGSYGRRTREALRQFQVVHNLVSDGLFGPVTKAALDKALADHGD